MQKHKMLKFPKEGSHVKCCFKDEFSRSIKSKKAEQEIKGDEMFDTRLFTGRWGIA